MFHLIILCLLLGGCNWAYVPFLKIYFLIVPSRFYTLSVFFNILPISFLWLSWLWWAHPICSILAKPAYCPEKGEHLHMPTLIIKLWARDATRGFFIFIFYFLSLSKFLEYNVLVLMLKVLPTFLTAWNKIKTHNKGL